MIYDDDHVLKSQNNCKVFLMLKKKKTFIISLEKWACPWKGLMDEDI